MGRRGERFALPHHANPMPPPQVTIPSSACAQRHQFAAAYSVLEQGVSQQAFPGASFGVLVQGEVLALDGVGGFTYGQSLEAVNASTVYDLASVTKVIATTSMAMLLYQRRQLLLDQSLVQIFPAFAQGEAAAGARHQVTLRMLLAHTSGLAGYVGGARNCSTPACACPLNLSLEAVPSTPTPASFCSGAHWKSSPARAWKSSARARFSLP
jgi:CubicO group peptidase (beta-lactamase class C family)